MTPAAIPPPPPLGRRLLRYILGFGVGFVVGLAPFLGRVKVPGFSALLELYPVQMQHDLIVLSGFLLGGVAVVVQFYATKASPAALVERHFRSLLKYMLVAFVLLVILYKTAVAAVPIEGSGFAVVVGWFRVESKACPCLPGSGKLECIKQTTLDPARLEKCWKYLPFFEIALTIPYLFLLGGFGSLVGLVILKEEEERRLKRDSALGPSPAPAAATRPRARPSARAKGSTGVKPEPSPGAKGKPASPGAGSEPSRNPKPKPSPGEEKRPGTRRRRPPSPPEEPPEA